MPSQRTYPTHDDCVVDLQQIHGHQVVGAPIQGIHPGLASVPQLVRNGQHVDGTLARDYANAIPYKDENHSGLYKLVCPGCGNYPICITLNCILGERCLCNPIICPFLLPCCCSVCTGEREQNNWVVRGGNWGRTGTLMCVDEENGTLARYCTTSTEPSQNPCCYSYRIGPNNGGLAKSVVALSLLFHILVVIGMLLLRRDHGAPCADGWAGNCAKEQCKVGFSDRVCLYKEDGRSWGSQEVCCNYAGKDSGAAKCSEGYRYEEGGTCGNNAITTCCYPE